VVAALAARRGRTRLLALGPARWLGVISYGLYLVHFPVIVGLRLTGHWPATFVAQLALVSAVTVPIAIALWFGVERPAIRWAQRRTAAGGDRRRIAEPAAGRHRARSLEPSAATSPSR
jgi:peptidoglycan/LPS O-acetylase OafA/YrhL